MSTVAISDKSPILSTILSRDAIDLPNKATFRKRNECVSRQLPPVYRSLSPSTWFHIRFNLDKITLLYYMFTMVCSNTNKRVVVDSPRERMSLGQYK